MEDVYAMFSKRLVLTDGSPHVRMGMVALLQGTPPEMFGLVRKESLEKVAKIRSGITSGSSHSARQQ